MRATLPYPPSANAYWRPWRGGVVKTPEARAYQLAVGLKLLALGYTRPPKGHVKLSLEIFRPRRRGDLTNHIKVLEDALQGHFFRDDEQVVELIAERRLSTRRPRVEVTAFEATCLGSDCRYCADGGKA